RTAVPVADLTLSVIPNSPFVRASVRETDCGFPFEVSAYPVRYDFDEPDLRIRDRNDPSVVLTQVVARHHPVNQAVLRLHEPVPRVGHLEGAHHRKRVERELLEELPAAVPIGAGRIGLPGRR